MHSAIADFRGAMVFSGQAWDRQSTLGGRSASGPRGKRRAMRPRPPMSSGRPRADDSAADSGLNHARRTPPLEQHASVLGKPGNAPIAADRLGSDFSIGLVGDRPRRHRFPAQVLPHQPAFFFPLGAFLGLLLALLALASITGAPQRVILPIGLPDTCLSICASTRSRLSSCCCSALPAPESRSTPPGICARAREAHRVCNACSTTRC